MEAEVILRYDNIRVAEAIAKAVAPDNLKGPPGLSIRTTRKAERVVTRISHSGGLPTFIATIDDLLFCVSMAEKAVQTASRLEKSSLTPESR